MYDNHDFKLRSVTTIKHRGLLWTPLELLLVPTKELTIFLLFREFPSHKIMISLRNKVHPPYHNEIVILLYIYIFFALDIATKSQFHCYVFWYPLITPKFLLRCYLFRHPLIITKFWFRCLSFFIPMKLRFRCYFFWHPPITTKSWFLCDKKKLNNRIEIFVVLFFKKLNRKGNKQWNLDSRSPLSQKALPLYPSLSEPPLLGN